MQNSSNDKLLALIAHLSIFTGVGYVLVPLIVWMVYRDKSGFVAHHSRQALIFQLGMVVLGSVFALLGFAVGFLSAGLGFFLFLPAALIASVVVLIPSIFASVQTLNGLEYRYPLTGSYAEQL